MRITIEVKNVNSPVQYVCMCNVCASVKCICMSVDIKFAHSSTRIQRVCNCTYHIDIFTVKRKKMPYAIAVVKNPFLLAKSLVIRKDWIYGLNEVKTLNNGVNRNQDHVVFYSKNLSVEADFTLPTKNVFDDEDTAFETENALYKAKISRYFGEFFFSQNFIIIDR